MLKVYIVAEVGCNHMGSLSRAKEMIKIAADIGVDVVKFQKRENRLLLTPEEYSAPHPVPENSYGLTYGAHREYLEFTADQHKQLMNECNKYGVEYSCSVWDRHSAWEIKKLKPLHIKIPSACNLIEDIYKELKNFKGTLHVSLGMTTPEEVTKVLMYVLGDYRHILYACTSGYPIENKDVYIYDVYNLMSNYWYGSTSAIGYSGHHLGTDIDLVAIGMGATWIERHFTLDREAKGTDHSASLDPEGLKELVDKVRAIEPALIGKGDTMPEVERVQREKLKRGV